MHLLFGQQFLFLRSLGVQIHSAVTTTRFPRLKKLPIPTVNIGDLEDFEQLAVGSDLLITNSHGVAIAQRLKIPLYRQYREKNLLPLGYWNPEGNSMGDSSLA